MRYKHSTPYLQDRIASDFNTTLKQNSNWDGEKEKDRKEEAKKREALLSSEVQFANMLVSFVVPTTVLEDMR